MEEKLARKDQRKDEQIARDAEIARIHAQEELQMLIDGLDRNNEMIAKYLQEYEKFVVDLSNKEKIDMINELVKYQDHYAKVLKYQSQQRKPLSKKQQRELYMPFLKSHFGWKTKHFKGMTLEEIREKFIPSNKDYWKIIRLGGHTAVYQFFVDMLKYFDREDLTQLRTLVKETLSIRQATSDKERELWVELKILYEPNFEDQLRSIKFRGGLLGIKLLSFPLPVKKFPLLEDFPTASEEVFPLLSLGDAPAEEVCTTDEVKV
nr:hypothetical protein [Tanacetum cinerariifolium]